jgi:hypothetical protein
MTSITISSLSSLIYYVMAATNKRYSYSRVIAIRIDVHHTGENLTNTTYAFHAQSVYDHTYLTWFTYSNLS